MVYIRFFLQGINQIYGHIRCIHTVLANPKNKVSLTFPLAHLEIASTEGTKCASRHTHTYKCTHTHTQMLEQL